MQKSTNRLRDNDLVAERIDRIAARDPDLASRGPLDLQPADDPPAVEEPIVATQLLPEVELLLREVSAVMSWPEKNRVRSRFAGSTEAQ